MKVPRVTLDQWRVLQSVVDYGGYAQAAAFLHRSQSSVSYAIIQLQRQLGTELLRIEGRKARLTERGEVLLRRARQLLTDAVELEQTAAELERGWEPEIRLVVDATFPTAYLMAVLRDFAPSSRGTRVQLKEVMLSGAEEALLNDSADLVISIGVPSGFLGDALLEVEFVAVAHPDHRLHRLGRALSARDLKRELQVVIRDSGVHLNKDAGWLGAEHRWTVTSMGTALEAVRHGLGFAWLPRHQISELLTRGELKELPLREGKAARGELFLIFGHPHNVGPATQKLADLFHAHAHACQQEMQTVTRLR